MRGNLFEAPVRFEDEDAAVLYLSTIILQHQVLALSEELSGRFLRVVAETVERFSALFCAGYVRLELWATRAG